MNQDQFLSMMENYAPSYLAEDFDISRIGFILNLLKYKNNHIHKIGICLDVTLDVLKKAIKDHIDILICHHNPLFNTKYKIENDCCDCLKVLFENNISLYCAHTNYDNEQHGMNYAFSKLLNLNNILFIEGVYIGEIDNSPTDQLIKYISQKLCHSHFLYIGSKIIKKVLVCCGSGFNSKNLDIAKKYNVDAFISSEWKHSNIIRQRGDIVLIDISHYDMENYGMQCLSKKIEKEYTELNVTFYNDPILLKSI